MARESSISCGRDLCCVTDLAGTLQQFDKGYDFVAIPIVHPRFRRDFFHNFPKRPGPITRSDKVIKVTEWSSLIVAKLSPWIQLDSKDGATRRNSEKAFYEEVELAIHLNVSAILIPLRSMQCENLARCMNHILLQNHHHVFWIQVPMVAEQMVPEGLEDAEVPTDPWQMWNKLRSLCAHSYKLTVALEVGSHPVPFHKLNRWCGELVKLVVMPTSVFLINKTGFPVLPVVIQTMLEKFFKLKTQFLVTGASRAQCNIFSYLQYLNFRYQSQPGASDMEVFSKGYEDYLQSPLQPLMDNLDSQTYDVFEKDPFKYLQYEKAVTQALIDRIQESEIDRVSVIMVVGAGRGPLVDASLRAAEKAEREVKVFAIEKNPGAVVTLLNKQIDVWGEKVTVVSSDMRKWEAPEKADILVSELLGSFGDNELSPECLDGAQRFLKPAGVCIPSSYTSFLAPVSSAKLHLEVSVLKDKEKAYPLANFETPYVVQLHNSNILAEPQACFNFEHPNKDDLFCNDRYISLDFQVQEASMLHGFVGYFDSVLYKDLHMSIHPHSHSIGMISWFPMFFPLKTPVYIEIDSTVSFHIWRLSDNKKVWYEWCLTQPQTTEIHNPRGRSYWIGL